MYAVGGVACGIGAARGMAYERSQSDRATDMSMRTACMLTGGTDEHGIGARTANAIDEGGCEGALWAIVRGRCPEMSVDVVYAVEGSRGEGAIGGREGNPMRDALPIGVIDGNEEGG